ncbi:unnamed protein product, partial [Symbiodinium microadriaticum]
MMTARSDSSREIRHELMKGQTVPEIRNTIPIRRYFHHAMNLYVKANESLKENYTARSYIYWKQFIIFTVDKLPSHKQYRLNDEEVRNGKEWCSRAVKYAFEVLESIVAELDHQEDMVRAACVNDQEFDLIDEFDNPPCDVQSACKSDFPVHPTVTATDEGEETSTLLDALSILKVQTQQNVGTMPSTLPTYPSLAPDITGPQPREEENRDNHEGVSVYDLEILGQIPGVRGFFAPQPHRTLLSFSLVVRGQYHHLKFFRHDFHVSFLSFLTGMDPSILEARPAVESNRCFFIHMGMAFGLHPFALQLYFRRAAASRMSKQQRGLVERDDLELDILQSCLQYAGFVDANCLMYIWPREFHNARICLISGSTNPIFTTFCSAK